MPSTVLFAAAIADCPKPPFGAPGALGKGSVEG